MLKVVFVHFLLLFAYSTATREWQENEQKKKNNNKKIISLLIPLGCGRIRCIHVRYTFLQMTARGGSQFDSCQFDISSGACAVLLCFGIFLVGGCNKISLWFEFVWEDFLFTSIYCLHLLLMVLFTFSTCSADVHMSCILPK